MPAALDVNKEAVQVLVGAVGVREAARQMGLSENTVLTWANKGGWVQHITDARERKSQSVAASRPNGFQSTTIKAATALENVLTEGALATRVGFTRYAAKMAKRAGERGLLEEAPLYKAVADIHGKMHPEVAVDQSTHLSFFSVAMERTGSAEEGAIDLPDVTSDPDPDPLEGY